MLRCDKYGCPNCEFDADTGLSMCTSITCEYTHMPIDKSYIKEEYDGYAQGDDDTIY